MGVSESETSLSLLFALQYRHTSGQRTLLKYRRTPDRKSKNRIAQSTTRMKKPPALPPGVSTLE
jgi:hypothetical protein